MSDVRRLEKELLEPGDEVTPAARRDRRTKVNVTK
jgi:hypothetical protein